MSYSALSSFDDFNDYLFLTERGAGNGESLKDAQIRFELPNDFSTVACKVNKKSNLEEKNEEKKIESSPQQKEDCVTRFVPSVWKLGVVAKDGTDGSLPSDQQGGGQGNLGHYQFANVSFPQAFFLSLRIS